jgi:sugar (pentulose or hexulose) kinase
MVSWGTTANVSVPVDRFPDPVPDGLLVTRGAAADGGWLLEGGLSGAGTLLDWLSALTRLAPADLMTRAAAVPAGAGGALALPWFGGARAPWWQDRAAGALVGLTFDHDAGHLARAVLESVAFEVDRARDQMGPASALTLTGGQGPGALWPQILTAVTGLPARRRGGQAASTGAALLTARAVAEDLDLDRIDPEIDTVMPDPAAVAAYADLRRRADAVARAVISLAP